MGKTCFYYCDQRGKIYKRASGTEWRIYSKYTLDDSQKKALGFCGSKSGRDVNKLKELGLTLEEPESISVPGIKELPLTLECRIVYKQKQDINAMEKETVEKFYPQNVESFFYRL